MSVVEIKDSDHRLLHTIIRKKNILEQNSERIDYTDPKEDLQVSSLFAKQGKNWKPHRHIKREFPKRDQQVQECFFVVKGSVMGRYFDDKDILIDEILLEEGDCSLTLGGGHEYCVISSEALVYEFKTGPYLGRKDDKIWTR